MQLLTKHALISLILLTPSALAVTHVFEREPNNTPGEALSISAPVKVFGTMSGTDQDAYRWIVSDEDARKRWNLELQGLPGRLTIVEILRLEYADNGVDVLSKQSLMKLGSRDGRSPAVATNLLFEPGEYLLGFAFAGGPPSDDDGDEGGGGFFRPAVGTLGFTAGDETRTDAADAAQSSQATPEGYSLAITEGEVLTVRESPGGRQSQVEAQQHAAGHEFAAFEQLDVIWHKIEFAADSLEQVWDISAQVPVGRHLQGKLIDADGNTLATAASDTHGKLVFHDLTPIAAGFWLELSTRQPGAIQQIGSAAVRPRVEGSEAEPNNYWQLANRIDTVSPVTGGAADKSDADYFTFVVDEAFADQVISIHAEGSTALELCLLNDKGQNVQCRKSDAPVSLVDVVLTPGDWGLLVRGMQAETTYSLSFATQGPIKPGFEAEPNDTVAYANSMPHKNRIKGRFSSDRRDDVDHYRVFVTTEPQLWRLQAIGDGVTELELLSASGKLRQRVSARGARRVRLENLFLLPGTHHVKVSGKSGDYTLLARPIGPPDPDSEREPNNDVSTMQPLAMGQERTGLLHDNSDEDFFYFRLTNEDHIQLQVLPAADSVVDVELYFYEQRLAKNKRGAPGEPIRLSGVFPPGDYRLQLSAAQPSDAEYKLSLARLPRFGCPVDCEPNGFRGFHSAAPLPADGHLTGVSGDWGDDDSFALPVVDKASTLTVFAEQRRNLKLRTLTGEVPLDYDAATHQYTAQIVPQVEHFLIINDGVGAYDLKVQLGDLIPNTTPPGTTVTQGTPPTLELDMEASSVAAYQTYGQTLSGQLKLTNTGATAESLTLKAATSDYRWQAQLPDSVEVAAGSTVEVPISLDVPRDARADRVVRLSIQASNEAGANAETWADIDVTRESPLRNAHRGWSVPEQLRGGINVAAMRHGGKWVGSNADFLVTRPAEMFDSEIKGRGMACCHKHRGWVEASPELVVELAQVTPVAGVGLVNKSSRSPYKRIRQATVLVSMDGESFQPVASIEPKLVEKEQFFPFAQTHDARFVKLRIDANFAGVNGHTGILLGEWKVIAAPGFDPTGGAGFNLADLSAGGHVVTNIPTAPTRQEEILDPTRGGGTARGAEAGESLIYVVGFHHNRAASITSVAWQYDDNTPLEHMAPEIMVAGSAASPTGPWLPLGELVFAEHGTATLNFEQPVWTRFVRFTTAPRQQGGRLIAKPRQIRITERPISTDYASILGEWGGWSPLATWEHTQPINLPAQPTASANTARAAAQSFAAELAVGGQVELGKTSHWYQIHPSAEHNVIQFTLNGRPTVRTALNLDAGEDMRLPLRRMERLSSPDQHVYEARFEPGTPLFVEVFEPPRNVIFTWDTSPSVNSYLPIIYNSLTAFANQVRPELEAVNLLPFGRGPLLDRWVEQPYQLHTILSDYLREGTSSSGETALYQASKLLAPRNGTKAVVTLTDGGVDINKHLWPTLNEIQPRVFSVQIGGKVPGDTDLMQDWAATNGGYYDRLVYDGDMAVAFDRAITYMRRPAPYALKYTTLYREAPGPGSLAINNAVAAQGTAIELILDASGSMLQRMEGQRRINVAKNVLKSAVSDHIPAGTPIALRVFGHQQPDACQTDLEVPLAPLNVEQMTAVIDSIQAKNLARTPIADSLKAISRDLSGHQGRIVVVLVTDGEETCEGDPEAVLAQLAKSGIEVSVNIVGFAIDDQDLADQFKDWAQLGSGRYFSADDSETLATAVASALRTSFEVFDQRGAKVAEGVVGGEPVEVEAGAYRVVVHTADKQVFDEVLIEGEQATTLTLEQN